MRISRVAWNIRYQKTFLISSNGLPKRYKVIWSHN